MPERWSGMTVDEAYLAITRYPDLVSRQYRESDCDFQAAHIELGLTNH